MCDRFFFVVVVAAFVSRVCCCFADKLLCRLELICVLRHDKELYAMQRRRRSLVESFEYETLAVEGLLADDALLTAVSHHRCAKHGLAFQIRSNATLIRRV